MLPSVIDYSVYLVLDPDLTNQYGMVETAVDAARAGAGVIQLRAPNWKKRRYYECALALKEALSPYATKLIINDHVDIALSVDADGVHVGQQDLPVNKVRDLIGDDKIIGLSINTISEIQAVNPLLVNYVGIGPVFETATKKDAAPAIGIHGFKTIASLSPVPCVAIGSVKVHHIDELVKAKASGIAVVSAICGQPDPYEATKILCHTWNFATRSRQYETI